MPPRAHHHRKDSFQLSKKKDSPGSSLGSTDSCFPNYTTSSLGYQDDAPSTASSSAYGYSGQTLDTDFASPSESGESAHGRVPPSDKKIKKKRAVEAPGHGTKLALRAFSRFTQDYGVSLDRKTGVLQTPGLNINWDPADSKTDEASRAECLRGDIDVDEGRVKVPKHKEVSSTPMQRGRSMPVDPSYLYPTALDGRHMRPTDSQRAKQFDAPDRNSTHSHRQTNAKDCLDPRDDLGHLVFTSVAELDRFRRSREHHAALNHGDKRGLSADPREKKGSPATTGTDDHRHSQHRPASTSRSEPLSARGYNSSYGSKIAPATPRNGSPPARRYSQRPHRPSAAPARKMSYERRRPNDSERRHALPERAASPIPGQNEHLQFLHARQQQRTRSPSPPQARRLAYLACGHFSEDNRNTQYLKLVEPPYEPYPADHMQGFSCLRLPDAALWDVHRTFRLLDPVPDHGEIRLYLLGTYPAFRVEVGKMGRDEIILCSHIHVIYVGGSTRTRNPNVVLPLLQPPGKSEQAQQREATLERMDFAKRFRHGVKLGDALLAQEDEERQRRLQARRNVADFRAIEAMRRGSLPVCPTAGGTSSTAVSSKQQQQQPAAAVARRGHHHAPTTTTGARVPSADSATPTTRRSTRTRDRSVERERTRRRRHQHWDGD